MSGTAAASPGNGGNHHGRTDDDIETGGVGGGDAANPVVSTTSLLSANSNLPPDPECKASLLKPIPETTVVERIAGGCAAAAVLSAIAAIVVVQQSIVVVAGLLSIVVGPYAYYQQTLLTDIRTLQETEKVVKQEVDKLQEENRQLADNVTDLTTSVQHLDDVQQALEILTNTQGQSIEAFTKQVEENKKILKKMKLNLKASVLQNLLSVILRSDVDGDYVIGESEVDDLVRRLNNVSGLKLRETKFRNAVTNKSVTAVMDVVRNLLTAEKDVPENEIIFEIKAPPTSQ